MSSHLHDPVKLSQFLPVRPCVFATDTSWRADYTALFEPAATGEVEQAGVPGVRHFLKRAHTALEQPRVREDDPAFIVNKIGQDLQLKLKNDARGSKMELVKGQDKRSAAQKVIAAGCERVHSCALQSVLLW